jgi:ferredoxin--NADP+ reductase
LHIRFLVSPSELIGDEDGRVVAMKLVHNELYKTDAGSLRPRATDQEETIDVGLVFRAVGYRGVPIPNVPFNDDWGVIMNVKGRVVDATTQEPKTGHYTAGWIKRGPSGVIGTNKPDAAETAELMLADAVEGAVLQPGYPSADAAEAMVRSRQPEFFSYDDWLRLDQLEVERGEATGRPRVKFTKVSEMVAARADWQR